jgi:hypothetical protein
MLGRHYCLRFSARGGQISRAKPDGNRTPIIQIDPAATIALPKAKALKLDHGLFVIGMEIGFVTERKAHSRTCSDCATRCYADITRGWLQGGRQ